MIPKATCDPESFPKAACWTWKLFQMPPMILKIVSNAACDPENCPNAICVPEIVPQAACESKSCSKCRLWFLKLFRMPPVILKIVPQATCDPENCSASRLWTWKLFQMPPVILKVVPNAACDHEIVRKPPLIPKVVPKAAYDIILAYYFRIQWWFHSRENRPMTEKRSFNRNSDPAFSAVFTISTIKHNNDFHFFS